MCRTLAVVVLLVGTAAVFGQGSSDLVLRGQSKQTYNRLATASRQLTEGKSAEAAEVFLRIMDEAGDDLVSEDGSGYRPARQLAQFYLARMPADVLKAYRLRADAPAGKLLEAGKKTRDPRPLNELIDRYFVSRPAEEALLLLGELAFERGEVRAAESHWRHLLPVADTEHLTYPDPRTDPAAVRARVILATIFQGETDRARRELAKFAEAYPNAAGRLAGQDGPYARTLQALLDRPPVFAAEVSGDGDWTALGGSASRAGRTTARLPRYWPGAPTWKTAIPLERGQRRPVYTPVSPARALAFHPVVLDGVAYLADSMRVFGFDLRTGEQHYKFDLRDQAAVKVSNVSVEVPVSYDADFTLTVADGRLFARLGSPVIAPTQEDTQPPVSYLVGFTPSLKMEWFLPPPAAEGIAATWEGAPVWANGRLYAAYVRFEDNRTVHAIACYDDLPGQPEWVADVCDGPLLPSPSESPSRPPARYRHELLTLAGTNVVFCSHSGAVVAVDTRSGKLSWALRYPKATRPTTTRDLNPAVAEGGRVFVAPTDADQIYALDAGTGQILWQKGPIQVNQFLGVTQGRLVCTIAGPNRGIRALNVVNGSDREPEGWAVHDDQQLRARGRGLVSNEFVLFPTSSNDWGLRFLNPMTGENERPPLPHLHGNLAYADGVLLVATPTELWGYVSERVQLAERKAAAAARLTDSFAARRLALALADAGLWDEAEAMIPTADPALDPARTRAEWLADRAERAVASGQIDAARKLLRQSLATDFPTDWRARAGGRLVTLEPSGGGAAAVERFLTGLGQPAEFADVWVLGPDGVPVRLRDLAARHFGASSPPVPPINRPVPTTTDSDIAMRHRLDSRASVCRETVFPSVCCVPLLPFEGENGLPGLGNEEPLLFVTDGQRVLAYPPEAAEPKWTAALPGGTAITHAAVIDNSVLVVGPHGVSRLRYSDGDRMWDFRFPTADPLPDHALRPVVWTAGGLPGGPVLSDFALAGPRLIARVGNHYLIALDIATGSVAWVRAADDESLLARLNPYSSPSGPHFARPYLADERGILVQLSNGKRWLLEPETGRVVHAASTATLPWLSPPVRLSSGRVAVADGPALIRGLEADPSRIAWTVDAAGEASQTGRPPQLAAMRDGLIVAISRNHGVEIERLLGAGGTRVWRDQGPALIPAGEVNLSAAGTDLVNLYVPAAGILTALRMTDGRPEWTVDLTSRVGGWRGSWQAHVGRRSIVVIPTEPVALDPGAVARAATSFVLTPGVWRVPGLTLALYDGWATRTVPILILDSETGRVRHRLMLPAAGPALGVHFGPEYAVVTTAGKAYWLK